MKVVAISGSPKVHCFERVRAKVMILELNLN
jgi:hypothetical protein